MDWNDLGYFLTIARSASLAKADRELSVEHTTVSRLGALEGDLGTRLFARGPAGLIRPAAGTGR
jgi:DNA-binding transcriptional LysR family regulator